VRASPTALARRLQEFAVAISVAISVAIHDAWWSPAESCGFAQQGCCCWPRLYPEGPAPAEEDGDGWAAENRGWILVARPGPGRSVSPEQLDERIEARCIEPRMATGTPRSINLGTGLDGKRLRRHVQGRTQGEVRRKLDELKKAREAGDDLAAPREPIVAEWVKTWMELVERTCKPSTSRTYRTRLAYLTPCATSSRASARSRHSSLDILSSATGSLRIGGPNDRLYLGQPNYQQRESGAALGGAGTGRPCRTR
jgi:hypothetical protein